MVLSSREARPRRGRGRAATARGTHRKGDAGGLGAQHSARHGTPPSAMPSARRVFPLESYSAYRGAWTPRFDGEWPRGEPDQIVSPMGTNKSLSAVATPPLLRERVQLYG